MDGIDVMMQESIFINVVLEEIVQASSVQELLDMEGGVTQEPPSSCSILETTKELYVGTNTTRTNGNLRTGDCTGNGFNPEHRCCRQRERA